MFCQFLYFTQISGILASPCYASVLIQDWWTSRYTALSNWLAAGWQSGPANVWLWDGHVLHTYGDYHFYGTSRLTANSQYLLLQFYATTTADFTGHDGRRHVLSAVHWLPPPGLDLMNGDTVNYLGNVAYNAYVYQSFMVPFVSQGATWSPCHFQHKPSQQLWPYTWVHPRYRPRVRQKWIRGIGSNVTRMPPRITLTAYPTLGG